MHENTQTYLLYQQIPTSSPEMVHILHVYSCVIHTLMTRTLNNAPADSDKLNSSKRAILGDTVGICWYNQ